MEDSAEKLEHKMYDGLTCCLHCLEQCQSLPLSKEEVKKELQKCLRSIKNKQQFAQLGQSLLQNTSWKDHFGLSDACMKALYEAARTIFEEKDYHRAENAFFVICAIDPTQFAYWIGLGHSSFQIQDYQQALRSYSMASAIDPGNIWPHIWAANCFEEEQEYLFAAMALNEALAIQRSKSPKDLDVILSIEERIRKIHRNTEGGCHESK
jgi:tetratricopeptide (TPR) repeat protein